MAILGRSFPIQAFSWSVPSDGGNYPPNNNLPNGTVQPKRTLPNQRQLSQRTRAWVGHQFVEGEEFLPFFTPGQPLFVAYMHRTGGQAWPVTQTQMIITSIVSR